MVPEAREAWETIFTEVDEIHVGDVIGKVLCQIVCFQEEMREMSGGNYMIVCEKGILSYRIS